MGGYVDIHAHVLPGIDDGPADLDEALAMARAAAEAGTETIVSTPHLHFGFPDVRVQELAERCADVSAAIAAERIPIRLLCGGEVSVPWAVDATDEELALATYAQRGKDLLIETPPMQLPGLDRFLYQLRLRGYRITLAHPERSLEFRHDHGPLRELVKQGVLLQVNAQSLVGSDGGGSAMRRLAARLVTEGLVHAIASDGHRAESWRPVTVLDEAVQAAAQLVGEARAQWMAKAAPAAIVEGAELRNPPPIVPQPRPRRRFWGR